MFNGDGFHDDDPFSSGMGFGRMINPFTSGIANPHLQFNEIYRCYPFAMMQRGNERDNVNYGGKIILPQSALEKLSQLNISYPMLFHITNNKTKKHTHSGVLEFIAEEGRAYLPQWMMQTLGLEPGELIEVKNTTLRLGSFLKMEPQSIDFLDISNPKAVLENALRNFSTMTLGDIIQITYNDKVYEIKILEVRPNVDTSLGISIVETDLEVDFAPPVGYVEPSKTTPSETLSMKNKMVDIKETQDKEKEAQSARHSETRTLRGYSKRSTTNTPMSEVDDTASNTGSESAFDTSDDGPLILPFGQLYFGFTLTPMKSEQDEKAKSKSSGKSYTLRSTKNSAGQSS